jgi:hypothetical protein
MRIKVLRTPTVLEVDGIDLQRFSVGLAYEVGNSLGALFLAEGWAEPVADDALALVVPFSDSDPFLTRVVDPQAPANLRRETYAAHLDEIAIAADIARAKRKPSR